MVILIREPLTDLVETKDLGDALPARGVPGGPGARRQPAARARSRPRRPGPRRPTAAGSPCGQLMKTQARCRSSTARARSSTARWRRSTRRSSRCSRAAKQAVSQRRAQAAYELALGQAHEQGSRRSRRANAAGQLAQQQEIQQLEQLLPELRDHGHADDRRPAVHPADRVRPDARGQPAEGALRLPVPDRELGADPGPAEGVAERRRSRRQAISWIRQAVKMPMFRSAYGGTYTVTGVPVVTNDLAVADHRLDRGAAGRRAARDGRDAAARVPQPAAAAAAGDRARGGRDHVRRDVAARRVADDGLDRGAADPDRARGRLRDPVPVARAGGAPTTIGRRAERRRRVARAAAAGPDDRDRRAGDRDRLPRAAALAGADGARLRRAAGRRDRDRARLRADRRVGGAGRCATETCGACSARRCAAPRDILAPGALGDSLRGAGELAR